MEQATTGAGRYIYQPNIVNLGTTFLDVIFRGVEVIFLRLEKSLYLSSTTESDCVPGVN